LRILHIINGLDIGGAQTVLIGLLRHWKDDMDQHMVLSLMPRAEMAEQVEALDIPIKYVDLCPPRVELSKLLKIRRIVRSFHPDVIQTWLYHANLIGGVGSRLAVRAPIVWGIHHSLTTRESMKPSTWLVVRWLARLSAFIPSQTIYCSRSALQTHLESGFSRKKTTVIANGVDPDVFRPDPSAHAAVCHELGLPEGVKLIGMFARYHPMKDHSTLLEAAGFLIRRLPDVHFVLAGQGVDRSNTRLQAQMLVAGVQDNVHLLGIRRDMPRLSAAMSLVTLSSFEGEALPVSLCEAMSCGVPCVATRVGDAAALIGDAGIVVEPRNPQQLADAWYRVLAWPESEYLQLSAKARERGVEDYNLSKTIDAYRQVYAALAVSR